MASLPTSNSLKVRFLVHQHTSETKKLVHPGYSTLLGNCMTSTETTDALPARKAYWKDEHLSHTTLTQLMQNPTNLMTTLSVSPLQILPLPPHNYSETPHKSRQHYTTHNPFLFVKAVRVCKRPFSHSLSITMNP